MIEAYRGIVPRGVLTEIEALAGALQGRALCHVNATRSGGGVSELLARLVPWTQALGIATTWEVLPPAPGFFEVTKALHNALQGAEVEIPPSDLALYLDALRECAPRLRLEGDVVLVHDPQPAYLIDAPGIDRRRFVWRCHIDLSRPSEAAWRFLHRAVERYTMAVFHVPQFARRLAIPELLIPPSIDPLSEKNRELDDHQVTAVTDRFGIDRSRPILVQVSRFDRFKDPLGVIQAFRMVRRSFDCQLVLAGGGATDDPEGAEVLAEVREAAGADPDIFVLLLPPGSDLEINALQRAATVVLQKSIREGFGLTVTEAMWKGRPVIGGAVGGIPSQIVHRRTGFLVHSPEGAAFRLRYLLTHPRAAQRIGEHAREHVRRNFLVTRHVRDYLLLMLLMLHGRRDDPIRLPLTEDSAPGGPAAHE
ncbi:MAG TPA: glycosyltransferase [Vicinamibacteria bacterium]|nr:glycosyltransferase [Vicinamibacteria bacterium]